MPNGRKISVSFVSELVPNDPSPNENNGHGNGGIEAEGSPAQERRDDDVVKVVQQKLLRLQVTEVILSLILVVLSAVAIIEERVLFSLGFCLISATAVILAGAIGLQQGNPRVTLLVNVLVLGVLIPAFYFTYVSLEYNFHHQQLQLGTNPTHELVQSVSISEISPIDQDHVPYTAAAATTTATRLQEPSEETHEVRILRAYFNSNGRPRASGTIWALGWLQLFLLVPVTGCILFKIHLLRFLYYNYYSNL